MRILRLHTIIDRYRHFVTIQNAGLVTALLIAVSWIWGSVATMQQNYQHQRQVDANAQQIAILKLQNQNYTYQQAYLKSDEFLELSARTYLMKALPGETMVILPDSSTVKDTVAKQMPLQTNTVPKSNVEKWMDFFFHQQR